MNQRPSADAAPVFAAGGHETRLSSEGPLSIAQLTHGGQVARQAVTKHLDALAGAGLVRSRKRIWELEPEALLDARAYLERVSAQWDVVLDRLQQSVELEGMDIAADTKER